MRLIDADTLKKRIKESTADKSVKVLAEVLVNTAPTVDAVPVVRCKDCKHHNKPGLGWCEVHLDRENLDDFCSYGKRKEGAEC